MTGPVQPPHTLPEHSSLVSLKDREGSGGRTEPLKSGPVLESQAGGIQPGERRPLEAAMLRLECPPGGGGGRGHCTAERRP